MDVAMYLDVMILPAMSTAAAGGGFVANLLNCGPMGKVTELVSKLGGGAKDGLAKMYGHLKIAVAGKPVPRAKTVIKTLNPSLPVKFIQHVGLGCTEAGLFKPEDNGVKVFPDVSGAQVTMLCKPSLVGTLKSIGGIKLGLPPKHDDTWVQECIGVVKSALKATPESEVILIGHSFGGAVSNVVAEYFSEIDKFERDENVRGDIKRMRDRLHVCTLGSVLIKSDVRNVDIRSYMHRQDVATRLNSCDKADSCPLTWLGEPAEFRKFSVFGTPTEWMYHNSYGMIIDWVIQNQSINYDGISDPDEPFAFATPEAAANAAAAAAAAANASAAASVSRPLRTPTAPPMPPPPPNPPSGPLSKPKAPPSPFLMSVTSELEQMKGKFPPLTPEFWRSEVSPGMTAEDLYSRGRVHESIRDLVLLAHPFITDIVNNKKTNADPETVRQLYKIVAKKAAYLRSTEPQATTTQAHTDLLVPVFFIGILNAKKRLFTTRAEISEDDAFVKYLTDLINDPKLSLGKAMHSASTLGALVDYDESTGNVRINDAVATDKTERDPQHYVEYAKLPAYAQALDIVRGIVALHAYRKAAKMKRSKLLPKKPAERNNTKASIKKSKHSKSPMKQTTRQ